MATKFWEFEQKGLVTITGMSYIIASNRGLVSLDLKLYDVIQILHRPTLVATVTKSGKFG